MSDQEVVAPTLSGEGPEDIGNDHTDKNDEEFVTDGVGKQSPGDTFVSGGIFRSDTDQFADNSLERPFSNNFLFAFDGVNTAVQHTVKVEFLFADVGQHGNSAVEEQCHYHGNEIELITVDGALDRVHFPDNVGVERFGGSVEERADTVNPIVFSQPGINDISPFALQENTADTENHTGQQRGPGTPDVSETAVKTEHHNRSAAALPHGTHQSHEKVDVVQLSHVERTEEEEHTDRNRDPADHIHVPLGGKGFLAQRQNNVLSDRTGGTVNTAVVGGNHRKDHHQDEESQHTVGQNVAHGNSQHHLMIKCTELLKKCAALIIGSFAQRFAGGIKIRGIKILLFRKGLIFADDVSMCRNAFNCSDQIFADLRSRCNLTGDLRT